MSKESHYFNVGEAVKYGMRCAIILYEFKQNKERIYNSEELLKIFPYFTEFQLRDLMIKMIEFQLVRKVKYEEEFVVGFLKSKIRSCLPGNLSQIVKCEWCKSETLLLVKHHYPIRKKDGGQEMVNICPNCHQEFHLLCDYDKFIFNDEYKEGGI